MNNPAEYQIITRAGDEIAWCNTLEKAIAKLEDAADDLVRDDDFPQYTSISDVLNDKHSDSVPMILRIHELEYDNAIAELEWRKRLRVWI